MPIHKYTQANASGRITTEHYADEINVINELRQITEDLAIILGQVKLGDGNYPADGTTGAIANYLKKCNYEAVAIPTIDDDSDEGYSKGSFWIYDEEAYICVDATVGAAVWKQITYYEELS